jgi:hypothetical protein
VSFHNHSSCRVCNRQGKWRDKYTAQKNVQEQVLELATWKRATKTSGKRPSNLEVSDEEVSERKCHG